VPRDALAKWGPHAVRDNIDRHVVPDWSDVVRDFDGVHLSWAGWITSEGFVADLPGGPSGVTRHARHTFTGR